MSDDTLIQTDRLPEGFVDCPAHELYRIMPVPTLIHLEGRVEQPLFVSILLHGNETTGLKTIQALLKKYQNKKLPRSLSIFVGNVTAAHKGMRRLDSQPDFNRIWPGTDQPESKEIRMARQVVEEMARRKVFASIDIHNNTGLNPHYACVNRLDHRFLNLANLFSRLVVFFIRPLGVQSAAFARLCPAVTLECGKPGQAHGTKHALEFLDACLHLQKLRDHPVTPSDIDLFHTVAQVNIRDHVDFSFNGDAAVLKLDAALDHMNFTEVPANTVWGEVEDDRCMPLIIRNEFGDEVTNEFFRVENHLLISTRPVMPSMLTLDEKIVRQDCLCYLMERMDVREI